MSAGFDPYREWLGIDNAAGPSHYQLLGLVDFETDATKISAAADARMKQVRTYQTGPRGRFTQKILNELASAKLCLLDAKAKHNYDAGLRTRSAVAAPAMASALPMPPPWSEPPIGPPPPAPPLAGPPLVRVSQPAVAPPEEDEETIEEPAPTRWWLPVAALFGIVIVGTLAAGALLALRKPQAKAPSKSEVTEEEVVAPPVEPGRKERELPTGVVISQEASGNLNLPMGVAELTGGLESQASGGSAALIGWAPDATATWKFRLVRPAIFKVQMVYTGAPPGAQWEFTADGETKQREIMPGEGGQPVTDEFFWRVTHAGEQELVLQVRNLPAIGELRLQSLQLIKQDAGRVK